MLTNLFRHCSAPDIFSLRKISLADALHAPVSLTDPKIRPSLLSHSSIKGGSRGAIDC